MMIFRSVALLVAVIAIAVVPSVRASDGHHGHTSSGTISRGDGDEHGGIGRPGDPTAATRTVEVALEDIKFSQAEIAVHDGETVRFVLHNRGKLLHEFNIGTPAMHRAHQTEMKRMFEQGRMSPTGMSLGMGHLQGREQGRMQDHMQGEGHGHMHGRMHGSSEDGDAHGAAAKGGMSHDDPNSVLVGPGETKELVWTFEKAAKLQFGCNVPGHYQAGMVGRFRFN